jgi:NACHT domain
LPITPLEVDAIQSTAQAIPYVAKRVYSGAQLRGMAHDARAKLPRHDSKFLDHLTSKQIGTLRELLTSPEFTHLSLQAIIFWLGRHSESRASDYRQQVRLQIQRTGEFTESELDRVTDNIVNLLDRSVRAIDTTQQGVFNHIRAAAIAAEIVASSARNSELMQRLESLADINSFAENLRAQARLMHTKIGTSHIGSGEGVNHSMLYITPFLSMDGDEITLDRLAVGSLRTVILGDPGAGKSTLSSKLVYDLANDKIGNLKGQVPILLVVRRYSRTLRAEHNTLVHYLEAACRQPYNVVPPPDALEYLLLNGRITLIIDGVDELGEGEYRRMFTTLINGFAHRYPLARIIVTSRIIGYRDAPLDSELFSTAMILPFTYAQVQLYAESWFGLDSSIPEYEVVSWVESFLTESAQAEDLRSNPLLLSLLCALFHTRHSLPRNKPEIYEKCAELLFDLWDRQRGIDVPYYFASHIRPAVQRIAWLMFNDASKRQALPRSELRSFLTDYMLSKRFPDPNEALRAAEDFLDFCADRAWVLTEVGSDSFNPQYGFVHRTFLEFFAASQLVRHGPDPDSVWRELRGKIGSSEWDVVSQLSAQILDRVCDDGADRLLQITERQAKASTDSNSHDKIALLTFATRTLDNVAPTNVTLDSIVRESIHIASSVAVERRRPLGSSEASQLIDEDSPLSAILNLRNPDNAERTARTVAQTLAGEISEFGANSSARLLCAILREAFLDGVTAAFVRSELQRVIPSVQVANWTESVFLLNSSTIQDFGLSSLYRYTVVGGFTIPSKFSQLVSARYADQSSQEASSFANWLDATYELIFNNWSPTLLGKGIDFELMRRIRDVDTADFNALPARAKASFLLLLIPGLRSFGTSRYAPADSTLIKLLTSAVSGDLSLSGRNKTIQLLSRLSLPFDTQWLLSELRIRLR